MSPSIESLGFEPIDIITGPCRDSLALRACISGGWGEHVKVYFRLVGWMTEVAIEAKPGLDTRSIKSLINIDTVLFGIRERGFQVGELMPGPNEKYILVTIEPGG